jgi:hypothetical protein
MKTVARNTTVGKKYAVVRQRRLKRAAAFGID